MRKIWNITVNGTNHTIEYKSGFSPKVSVDGQMQKVKSQNWFIVMIDYPILIEDTEVRVVVVGTKADLAINGVYQSNGSEYQPLHKIPMFTSVFIGLSVLGGYFLSGIFGLLVGVLFSVLYVKLALAQKNGAVIAAFIGCTLIQIVLLFVLGGLLFTLNLAA